jgi:esterase/lipase superfamily enzyme
MATVYFGTNRRQTGPLTFGAAMGPLDRTGLICAEAAVDGLTLANADSGTITAITHETATGFAPATRQAILGSGKDLLVFIHGFANAFEAAISRAAFNREWFASSTVAGADMTVLAFTWPSEGALIAVPPHFLSGAYRADQARAGSSGAHLAWFLDEVKSLRDDAKRQNPSRRVVLLAHSMGNFALAAGVQAWFLSRDTTAIFDYAVLAAADEIDKSFELPAGARLSRLADLAAGISVYYSLRDVAMYLSQAINLTERLGFDGPAQKSNTTVYPPNQFRSINCTELNDYNSITPPDSSHQYYRRSPKARDDIARAFTGQPVAPGESNLA